MANEIPTDTEAAYIAGVRGHDNGEPATAPEHWPEYLRSEYARGFRNEKTWHHLGEDSKMGQ